MLKDIEKLSQILNESYSEKSLQSSLADFFKDNFKVNDFSINIYGKNNISNPQYSYPIYKHKKCLGSLDFSNADTSTKNFVEMTAQFISLKIQNIMLNEKMQRDIDFHDTMKNIAKMIETQYELKYIIPIIGEMLDKFFEDYLIYVFLKDENKKVNTLSWPNNCNDNNSNDVYWRSKYEIFHNSWNNRSIRCSRTNYSRPLQIKKNNLIY